MRLLATCATAMCFALPATAFDMPAGFEKIGAFSGEYNGKRLDLVSTSNADIEFSDLHFVAFADQNQRWVKSFTVQATNGIDADGKLEPELFSVEFDQNPKTKALEVFRVILVDEAWGHPYPESGL